MRFLSNFLRRLRCYKDLHEAAENGDLRAAKRFVRRGADVNDQDRNTGYAPLHAAVSGGNQELVRFLIDNGAQLEVYTSISGSPLCQAVAAKNTPMVKLLLEKGADPNSSSAHVVEDFYGTVVESYVDPLPLLVAVQNGNQEIVQLLLSHGANTAKASSRRNVTAIDAAQDDAIRNLLANAERRTKNVRAQQDTVADADKPLGGASPSAEERTPMAINVKKMGTYCVVCGETWGPYMKKCCGLGSLVATTEAGFFRKKRRFFDLAGNQLTDTDLAAIRQQVEKAVAEAEAAESSKSKHDAQTSTRQAKAIDQTEASRAVSDGPVPIRTDPTRQGKTMQPETWCEIMRESDVPHPVRVYARILGILALIAGVVGGFINLVRIVSSLRERTGYSHEPTDVGRAFQSYHSSLATGAIFVFILELILIFAGIACLKVASGNVNWQTRATASLTVAGSYSLLAVIMCPPYIVIALFLLVSAFVIRPKRSIG